MRFSRKRRFFDSKLVAEINVTPLVDVILVLLIIFMVTAPMLSMGIDVNLPRVKSKTIDVNEEKLVLTINKDREIFINRTKGVAVISAEDALNWSLSGPMLRGSGVARDLRKDEPYSGYENFDFQIALGHNGDAYDRYLLRMEEIRQSLRICRQGIDGLPEGPYRAHVPGVVLPPKEDVLYKMESMIFHFKIITEGFAAPLGSVYQAIESPKGELGFYVVGDGTTMPRRIRVRPPSLINLASLPRLVEGRLFSDVICAIGSIDIVLGEVDR